MKDLTQFTIKVQDALTKLRDEFEANHDDLVRITGYALDAIKFPSPGTSTPVPGKAPAKPSPATQVKPTATPSNPIVK